LISIFDILANLMSRDLSRIKEAIEEDARVLGNEAHPMVVQLWIRRWS
jgi:hypothetical protein